MNALKIIARFTSVLAVLALLFGARASSVQAYGNTALYQIGISGNCDNPSLCGSDLGGFWGWVEFDQGGSGDATLAGCSHLVAAGPVHMAGAQYFSIDITGWHVEYGMFVIDSGTMTFRGSSGTVSFPITQPMPTGIPASAGHYSTMDLMGFSAPGVNFQMQVVQIPH